MKKLVPILGVASLLLAAAPCGAVVSEGAAKPSAARDNAALVATANNAFAADLYGKLAAKEGNFFFSPNSIETALVMTYAGARGKTADQMAAVLHLPAKNGSIHSAFSAFLKDLNAEKGPDGKPRGYQLSVANALWGQDGYGFLPQFMKTVKTHYGAGLSEVDFIKDTEGARRTINTWVEKETRDKIKDLIAPGILGRDTKLVLTNAIYFKGNWAEQFKKEATQDAPFHLTADKVVQAPLMNRTGEYGYFEEEMFQGLKLPYVGNELSIVIVLPKKVAWVFEGQTVDALTDLEKELTPGNLNAWMGKFHKQQVIVSIPKFKMTAEFELNKTLAAMGMADAFSETAADFSGMTGKQELFISNVIHKAFVDVNEEGTEAAAATAVAVAPMAMPMPPPKPPIVFKADHPFLFLIRHEASGAILFMGRLADPTK